MKDRRFYCIVVGARSSGCVPANRLLADERRRVLLLEAGLRGHWITRLPVSFSKLIDDSAANWCFRSELDESSGGRAICSSVISPSRHVGNPRELAQHGFEVLGFDEGAVLRNAIRVRTHQLD